MEGLRLLPYFQETRRSSNYPGAKSCAECRERVDVTTRQDMGCVYEEPTKAPQRGYVLRPAPPWRSIVDNAAIPPSVCPLYLGHVAEASDVQEALPFYRRGADFLRAWLGDDPDRGLLEALEAHEDGVAYWRGDPLGGGKAGG